MADLTISAANVTPATGARVRSGTCGEAITAGQGVYLKASDNKIYKAQSDVDAASAAVVGVAINSTAAAGQPVSYVEEGPVNVGSALTAAGNVYWCSTAAGGICPVADVASTNFQTAIGWSTSATVLYVKPYAVGLAKP